MKKIILILIALLFSPLITLAASTAPTQPGTAVNDTTVGTVNWTIGTTHSATLNFGSTLIVSRYFKGTNYGFTVPANATITGISITIKELKQNSTTVTDNAVRIVKADGSIGTTNKASATWTISSTDVVYGSSSDLWGETWTPAAVNNSNFGFVIAVNAQQVSFGTQAFISDVHVTVFYSTPLFCVWGGSMIVKRNMIIK